MSRVQVTLRWMRAHKVKTFLLLLLALFLYEVATIPWFGVPSLRTQNPTQTALMKQRLREAEEARKRLTIRTSWVPILRIPKHMVDAVVVAEDGTFYTHNGFDWYEVKESVERNVKERRAARGASTITQQLAKNLYLSTSKDPIRKLKEAVITLLLEHYLTKNRILEIYLNVIEWGPGVFGVDAAARTYFGKSAASLSLDESLRLAAVIPSPLRHRPDVDSRYVVRRKEIVRRRMFSRSFIPFPEEEEVVVEQDQQSPVRTGDGMSGDRDGDTSAAPAPVEGAHADSSNVKEGKSDGLE